MIKISITNKAKNVVSAAQQLTTLKYDEKIVELNMDKGMCLIAAFFNSLPGKRRTTSGVIHNIRDAMELLIEHVDVSHIFKYGVKNVNY